MAVWTGMFRVDQRHGEVWVAIISRRSERRQAGEVWRRVQAPHDRAFALQAVADARADNCAPAQLPRLGRYGGCSIGARYGASERDRAPSKHLLDGVHRPSRFVATGKSLLNGWRKKRAGPPAAMPGTGHNRPCDGGAGATV
jgi:hypothetical protein